MEVMRSKAGDGYGRSPHGERGLKYQGAQGQGSGRLVALLMESVD